MSVTVQKEGLDAETIRKYEAEYVLTPWTAQKGLNPFVAAKAKGCWVYNKEGRKSRTRPPNSFSPTWGTATTG